MAQASPEEIRRHHHASSDADQLALEKRISLVCPKLLRLPNRYLQLLKT